ncbi:MULTISPECIES: LysR family transcriptional regulator [unclassified Fusibacter]|uniref:LysR family transcriptional regulator n=1 Tax=unclassified Fusibacter TaxID=2624464 RepID=UPI001012C1AF|nr:MULTISPECIES: LysR family transcriptional regulator [unclassified Fusibacter]MCK8058992.1 LysR family transcriptional regulator [Fusibacter sp. A2]NPE22403.1 LysR family transcriptional regulator [Fusibacter sp. A1]RXV60510.1 LysR family transcriptional regulator [Fusibacter sp. A1]
MDIRQLKYFVAVAEKLSFTEAAKSLYVAQSAVSQQISELEKKLGIPLFNRNRRSVKLTPAGNVLYCEAIGLLKRLDEVQEITMKAHLGYKGHLRIGYIGYGDRTWLPKILNQFHTKYPDVTLEVNRYHQGELTKALNEDALDLVITFSFGISESLEELHNQTKIETHHICTEILCAVLASDSKLAKEWVNKTIPLKALAKESFIIQNRHESPQGFDKTLQICTDNGFSPKIVNTPNLVQTVLVLVEAHMGVALLPSSLKDYAGPNLTFLELDVKAEHRQNDIVAAWKTGNMNPSLSYLTKLISEGR